MISHTTLGTNNLIKAECFYSDILKLIDATQVYKSDKVIFWQFKEDGAKLAITVPFDGAPATHGNGTMLALSLSSINQVNEVFSMAIKAGATSEGEPGQRNEGAYYGAYFRDLDGNKIAIFHR